MLSKSKKTALQYGTHEYYQQEIHTMYQQCQCDDFKGISYHECPFLFVSNWWWSVAGRVFLVQVIGTPHAVERIATAKGRPLSVFEMRTGRSEAMRAVSGFANPVAWRLPVLVLIGIVKRLSLFPFVHLSVRCVVEVAGRYRQRGNWGRCRSTEWHRR